MHPCEQPGQMSEKARPRFGWARKETKKETTLPAGKGREGSRYIYDLYYEKEAISKQLYDWLLKNQCADANLIAKWKKQGYEKLCCLRCIQTKETNFKSTCICRVPQQNLKEDHVIECVSCGCRGCSSGD